MGDMTGGKKKKTRTLRRKVHDVLVFVRFPRGGCPNVRTRSSGTEPVNPGSNQSTHCREVPDNAR